MLILNVFLIFTAIFAILYYETQPTFFDPNMKTLLQSFSMYARAFGRLPENNLQQEIPWARIGISNTFFQQKLKYQANSAFLNSNLLPIDFKFMIFPLQEAHNTIFAFAKKYQTNPEFSFANQRLVNIRKNNIYWQEGTPYTLKAKNIEYQIDMNLLADYTNYPIRVAKMGHTMPGDFLYNIYSIQFILNLMHYY